MATQKTPIRLVLPPPQALPAIQRTPIRMELPAPQALPGQPIRLTLPATRPADASTPKGRKVQDITPRMTFQDAAAAVFPQTTRAIVNSNNDQKAALAKGDTARAIGASMRQLATVPAGIAYDATVPTLSAIWNGGGRMLGGLVGSDGTDTVNKAYTPPAPANPVNTVLGSEPVAPAAMTAQDQMLAQLSTILGSGKATMSDLKAVSGMMPAPAKAPDLKDGVLATTAAASQAVYDSQIKDIMARRAAGDIDLATAKADTAKATDAYINRNSGLLGNNLLTMAQANMIQPTDEEQ